MRPVLLLFPRAWRDRYGEEFIDQFDHDSRRISKWIDLTRVAGSLRWRSFCNNGEAVAVVLLAGLVLPTMTDFALGVGMDERIGPRLANHWWGAPFLVLLGASAALVVAGVGATVRRGRLRSAALFAVAIAVTSFAGSALLAMASRDLAELGAAIGLFLGVLGVRMSLRLPLQRGDAVLAAALPVIVVLGLRTASTPLGPASLLMVTGLLLASRERAHPRAASTE
jgi:hypothetical protein